MRSNISRAVIVAVSLWSLLHSIAWADYPLDIVNLSSRPAEDLLPLLVPIAGPGGTVTGTGSTLFIRASPQTLEEIRRALQHLDRAPRNLLIQVRQNAESDRSGSGVGLAVDEVAGDRVRIRTGPPLPGGGTRVEAFSRNRRGEQEVSQEVRVLEGHRAFIAVGSDYPVGYQERHSGPGGTFRRSGVTYERRESGFYVLPRVTGDRVTLEISAFASGSLDRLGSTPTGAVESQVSGNLGEWISLGGASVAERHSQQGLLHRADGQRRVDRDIYLRVVELP
jgi:hypothetical protein